MRLRRCSCATRAIAVSHVHSRTTVADSQASHTFCLDPPLHTVPSSEWYCTPCLLGSGDDYGFEEGEDHSIASFRARDEAFSYAWWNKHRPPNNQSPGSSPGSSRGGKDVDPLSRHFGRVLVTEDDVEREFWRLTESSSETVEVEYGADVHSDISWKVGSPTYVVRIAHL